MRKGKPPHVSLNSNKPPNWNGGQRQLNITLNYEPLKPFSDTMVFEFMIEPENYPEYLRSDENLQFGIADDCTLMFILDSKREWRWSKKYFVITTKKNYSELYGDVHDIKDRSFKLKAKCNEGIMVDKIHGFNLNIDYYQGDGRWLPITIDPDIGNPKPRQLVGQSGPFKIIPTGNVEEE